MNLNLISKRLVDNWYINWMFQYRLFCLFGPIHSHKLIWIMTNHRWMYNRTNEEFYRFIFETNGYRCEDVCLFLLFLYLILFCSYMVRGSRAIKNNTDLCVICLWQRSGFLRVLELNLLMLIVLQKLSLSLVDISHPPSMFFPGILVIFTAAQ